MTWMEREREQEGMEWNRKMLTKAHPIQLNIIKHEHTILQNYRFRRLFVVMAPFMKETLSALIRLFQIKLKTPGVIKTLKQLFVVNLCYSVIAKSFIKSQFEIVIWIVRCACNGYVCVCLCMLCWTIPLKIN